MQITLSQAALHLRNYKHTEGATRQEVLTAARAMGLPVVNSRVHKDSIAGLYFAVQAYRKGNSA